MIKTFSYLFEGHDIPPIKWGLKRALQIPWEDHEHLNELQKHKILEHKLENLHIMMDAWIRPGEMITWMELGQPQFISTFMAFQHL